MTTELEHLRDEFASVTLWEADTILIKAVLEELGIDPDAPAGSTKFKLGVSTSSQIISADRINWKPGDPKPGPEEGGP